MISRVPVLCMLAVALVLGAAPWRVVGSAHAGHGALWLPGLAHDHDERPAGLGASAAACPGSRVAGTCDHDHDSDHGHHDHHDGEPCDGHEAPHCHCDDAPSVPGLLLARVALAPPAASLGCPDSGEAVLEPLGGCAPEGPRPRPPRVACEEEPTVLLR